MVRFTTYIMRHVVQSPTGLAIPVLPAAVLLSTTYFTACLSGFHIGRTSREEYNRWYLVVARILSCNMGWEIQFAYTGQQECRKNVLIDSCDRWWHTHTHTLTHTHSQTMWNIALIVTCAMMLPQKPLKIANRGQSSTYIRQLLWQLAVAAE